MKTLLITASPHRGRSTTRKIADAFLRGAGCEDPEVIDLYACDIAPCQGCLTCWFKTPGECIQKDDAPKILKKIDESDLVVWAAPLYFFGLPSELKRLIDRMLSRLKPPIYDDIMGHATHPGFGEFPCRHVYITSGAFPDVKGNFDAAEFQMKRTLGYDTPMIACCEATLFLYKKRDDLLQYARDYLALTEQAGREFAADGKISDETLSRLNQPMMERQKYIDLINKK
ncbi:MAG: flavodoxin family protein [Anaerovoracaceae bacterium]|jgi:hypothetical protein